MAKPSKEQILKDKKIQENIFKYMVEKGILQDFANKLPGGGKKFVENVQRLLNNKVNFKFGADPNNKNLATFEITYLSTKKTLLKVELPFAYLQTFAEEQRVLKKHKIKDHELKIGTHKKPNDQINLGTHKLNFLAPKQPMKKSSDLFTKHYLSLSDHDRWEFRTSYLGRPDNQKQTILSAQSDESLRRLIDGFNKYTPPHTNEVNFIEDFMIQRITKLTFELHQQHTLDKQFIANKATDYIKHRYSELSDHRNEEFKNAPLDKEAFAKNFGINKKDIENVKLSELEIIYNKNTDSYVLVATTPNNYMKDEKPKTIPVSITNLIDPAVTHMGFEASQKRKEDIKTALSQRAQAEKPKIKPEASPHPQQTWVPPRKR